MKPDRPPAVPHFLITSLRVYKEFTFYEIKEFIQSILIIMIDYLILKIYANWYKLLRNSGLL